MGRRLLFFRHRRFRASMTASSEFDLECEAVSKSFGPVRAVDEVSVGIPSGSFFSILGPSGCGKTTLMRMIAGFEDPSAGAIRITGRPVVEIGRAARREGGGQYV